MVKPQKLEIMYLYTTAFADNEEKEDAEIRLRENDCPYDEYAKFNVACLIVNETGLNILHAYHLNFMAMPLRRRNYNGTVFPPDGYIISA